MEIKSAFFAIIIVGMMVMASGIILSNWAVEYDSGISSDLEADFNKISDASDEAQSQKGSINPQSGEASSDFETETFRGGYGIITNIFAPLRIVYGEDGMIDSVVERIGLPNYIWNGWVAMIMFAIIATIIAIVFRRSRSSV